MKHANCGGLLTLHRFTTFQYWMCGTCRQEPANHDIVFERDDLVDLGWKEVKHPQSLNKYWQFKDNEPNIWIDQDDALVIQKNMMKGLNYDEAERQWLEQEFKLIDLSSP